MPKEAVSVYLDAKTYSELCYMAMESDRSLSYTIGKLIEFGLKNKHHLRI